MSFDFVPVPVRFLNPSAHISTHFASHKPLPDAVPSTLLWLSPEALFPPCNAMRIEPLAIARTPPHRPEA